MYKDITGILLAGGKSSRMGVNKSFLKYNGKYIIEHIHDKLKSLFEKVIVITNSPAEYAFLGSEIHEDIYKGKGPLGGIHSGLTYSTTYKNFIISCDVPLVSIELIKYIIEQSGDTQITAVEADGHVQKLCGMYKKDCLKNAEQLLQDENNSICRVSRLISRASSNIIQEFEIPFDIAGQFLNMNTPQDFKKLTVK